MKPHPGKIVLSLLLALCLLPAGTQSLRTPVSAAAAPPAVPASPVAKAGMDGSINLSWGAVSGASGYVVYRCTRESTSVTRCTVVKSTAFTDKNIAANTLYKYKVRAYATAGGVNIYGGPSGFFYTPEIPISGLTSKVSSLSVRKAWYAADSRTGTTATILKLVYKNALKTTYKTATGKVYYIYPACYLAQINCKPENFRNTCAEQTLGKDEALTNDMAKKTGALVAVNNEYYDGHWNPYTYATFLSAGPVIKESKIVQNKGGSDTFTAFNKNGTWMTRVQVSSKTQAENLMKEGVHFSIGSQGGYAVFWNGRNVRESALGTQTILFGNLSNRTYIAQIDATHYLLAVGEFMPQIMLESVLKAYGAKNFLQVNGGNCSYMYLRNCGNVTGASGASLVGLDKINVLEQEWLGSHGYLPAGKSGGPCPAKDIIFVK